MNEIIVKIIPVILIFILGYFLKRIKVLDKQNGDLFLKVVFNIALPALIILSITNIDLTFDLMYLPLIAVLVIMCTYFISRFIGKFFHLNSQSFVVFLVASLIMNIGFTLPFFIAAYGDEGLARISIFDFANGLLTFTFIYYLACKFGGTSKGSKVLIKKFIYSPPLWALIVALVLNLINVKLPHLGRDFFQILGNMTIPLIMLSLGIYFSPRIIRFGAMSTSIFIRMGVGFLLGLLFVNLFNLEGLNQIIVLIGASAPVGYNTLTFSSMENLDKEFAASIISYSILIGIIFIPLLIFFLD